MAATPVYEFGNGSSNVTAGGGDDILGDIGEAYETVPGNIGGTELQISRYDLYTSRFETAFGTTSLDMLVNQRSSIRFVEIFKSPGNDLNFGRIFYGCWFTRKGRNHDANSTRIEQADASAMYARARPAIEV